MNIKHKNNKTKISEIHQPFSSEFARTHSVSGTSKPMTIQFKKKKQTQFHPLEILTQEKNKGKTSLGICICGEADNSFVILKFYLKLREKTLALHYHQACCCLVQVWLASSLQLPCSMNGEFPARRGSGKMCKQLHKSRAEL